MSSEALMSEARGLVDGERVWEDLQALIRWERYTGTEGEREAARYIHRRLEAEGIPAVLHRFEVLSSLPGSASIEVIGPEAKTLACATHSFGASTGGAGVEGEAVRVDEKGAPAGPLEGKIALVEGLVAPGRFYDIERRGAVAQVYVNKGELVHELTVGSVWGSPAPEDLARMPRTPVASVPRGVGAPWLAALADGRSVRLRLRAEVDTRWRGVEMPEAVVEAPSGAEEYLLVSAHMCSWYEGAMDNATGDVLLMELARAFHRLRGRLRRGARFLFWIGHSQGRFAGSAWYADRFWSTLRDRCVGHLNVDQVGFRDGRNFRVLATEDVAGWACEAIHRESGQEVTAKGPTRNSDQSFWGLGLPAFTFRSALVPESKEFPPDNRGNGLPWYWHHRDDTLDKIDKSLLAEQIAVHAGAAADFLTREIVPLDPEAQARALAEALERLAGEADEALDLGPLRQAAADWVGESARLREAIAGGLSVPPAEANRSLLRIARGLTSVFYTRSGPYHQDPARNQPRLPGLEPLRRLGDLPPNERRSLLVRLVRERNRVADALADAGAEATRLLGRN